MRAAVPWRGARTIPRAHVGRNEEGHSHDSEHKQHCGALHLFQDVEWAEAPFERTPRAHARDLERLEMRLFKCFK